MAINLLPRADKLALEWDRRRRIAVAVAIRLIVGAAVLWAMLGGIEWYLRTEADRIMGDLTSQRELLAQSELQQLESSFQKTVRLAHTVEAVAGSVRPVSSLLIEVARLIAPGVELKSIEYTAHDRRVSLRGHAPTRELVIRIGDAIRREPRYTNVDAPATNLVKPTSIDFSFAFSIATP